MKCLALYVDFNGIRFEPREVQVRAHQICVPPWKRAISATVDYFSMRMVADRHRLAAYYNTHYWRAFRGYQHRWPWTTLNPKNMIFKWFFLLCYFRLWRTLSEFSLKCNGDRPREPAYEIKLMLSCVSWVLAQISCLGTVNIASVLLCTVDFSFKRSVIDIEVDDYFCSLPRACVWLSLFCCEQDYLNVVEQFSSNFLYHAPRVETKATMQHHSIKLQQICLIR